MMILLKIIKKRIKLLIFLFIFLSIKNYLKIINEYKMDLNYEYLKYQITINLTFNNEIKRKINIALYSAGLKYGGTERITALLINYFFQIKIFKIFLFTRKLKEENEYFIPENIKRSIIKENKTYNLIKEIRKNRIEILIYQFANYHEVNILNKIKDVKILFYNHFSFFYWIYLNYKKFSYLYSQFINSKYIISLIPLENDYLFKKWGINSILMNNFITYNYQYIFPSNLYSKVILMIGRVHDRIKRFELGILAMEYIIQEIHESKLKIICNYNESFIVQTIVYNLNLNDNVKFVGYTSSPEIYYKDASLHFFLSISEAFPMVLCETKIYGIPSILLGLDYISIKKGGIIMIFDDLVESLAKESIKILNNDEYKKLLGDNARRSIKKYKSEILIVNWIKLLMSIYNGDKYYQKFRDDQKKMNAKSALNIINNQVILLKKRVPTFNNITVNDFYNLIDFMNSSEINQKGKR